MKLGFFSILLILAFIFTGDKLTFISLLSSFIHECGHLFVARILNIKFDEFNYGAFGARLKTSKEMYSYKKEVMLCFAGPLANFVSALIVYIIPLDSFYSNAFIVFSLSLGVLNILPICSFDGGRISEAIMLQILPVEIVERVLRGISFIIIFTLWCVSVYFLLRYSSSLNLFIFSSYLFCSLFIDNE